MIKVGQIRLTESEADTTIDTMLRKAGNRSRREVAFYPRITCRSLA